MEYGPGEFQRLIDLSPEEFFKAIEQKTKKAIKQRAKRDTIRNNKGLRNQFARKQRRKRRQRLIKFYGGECECCGLAVFEFLTFAHINGDGAAHRRELNGSVTRFISWLDQPERRPGIGVQCYNCNCASNASGVCPRRGQPHT